MNWILGCIPSLETLFDFALLQLAFFFLSFFWKEIIISKEHGTSIGADTASVLQLSQAVVLLFKSELAKKGKEGRKSSFS